MAVPAGMEATYDKWQKWVQLLSEGEDCVAKKLDKAAELLEQNIGLQNSGKWTDEPGPKAFSAKYADYLTQESDALRAMANNAREFAARVKTAITNLENGDAKAGEIVEKAAKDIPPVYVSAEKEAAWKAFLAHPSLATYAAYKKYIY